jgi:hypothetical protein
MTATEARHGPILLPTKCSCSAHAYNRGSIPTPDPRFAGDRGSTPIPIPDFKLPGIGGPPPPPPPICRGSGIIPIPGSHRGFRALPRAGSPAGSATGSGWTWGVGPARGQWTNLGRLPLRVLSIGKYAFQKKPVAGRPHGDSEAGPFNLNADGQGSGV